MDETQDITAQQNVTVDPVVSENNFCPVCAPSGISKKWKDVARMWLGDEWGRHCHWCKFIEYDDGCSFCKKPKSKFADGNRIRSWDGKQCAEECGLFELKDWYKDDKKYDEYLRGEYGG